VIAITKVVRCQLCGAFSCLDLVGIVDVSISEVVEEVAEWKSKKVPSELDDVNQFVEDQFDRALVYGVDWAMPFSQIDAVSQRETGHIPVPRNPPEWYAPARAKSQPARISDARYVNPNPFH
jgi:hypothetical protein